MWHKKYKNCLSCRTTLFSYKANGLCSKCHRVDNEIAKIKESKGDDLDFYRLKYCGVLSDFLKKESERKIKKCIISSLEYKVLRHIRAYGKIESGKFDVEIDYMEILLNDIANYCGHKNNLFTNKLSIFNTEFNKKQRNLVTLHLLRLLIK